MGAATTVATFARNTDGSVGFTSFSMDATIRVNSNPRTVPIATPATATIAQRRMISARTAAGSAPSCEAYAVLAWLTPHVVRRHAVDAHDREQAGERGEES
jgi:hypothetical protein